jgi:hypothetical protein
MLALTMANSTNPVSNEHHARNDWDDELRVLIFGIRSSGFVVNTAYEFKVFSRLYSFPIDSLANLSATLSFTFTFPVLCTQ